MKNMYNPPFLLFNKHLQTIYPSLFRKVDTNLYQRERIDTPDGDFLDLDWVKPGNNKLAILSHGLEGSSHRSYMIGMARALNSSGWDALAWNFRFCSGEPNNKLRMYHSGTTDDLATIIAHAQKNVYKEIALIGFSMGANQILVYLGQQGDRVPKIIKKAVVFSVPCDLKGSANKLAKWSNKIYMNRFIKMLGEKIEYKSKMFPDQLSFKGYENIKTFKDFDDRYTAPIHGFKNAEDYWAKCSSKQFIKGIKRPALIVNALNDPFLSKSCFPYDEVADNSFVSLETPKNGGHVGFVSFNRNDLYWSEKRALMFLKK